MIGNFDVNKQFDTIKKAAVSSIKQIFPVEGTKRRITLENVWVDDSLNSSDYRSQLKTKERNGTWGVPVYASLRLIDKATGKVIDSEEKMKLFALPKVTDRFSYIVGGNEYQVSNQLRRRPGVYTLRKQNGELKTSVNTIGKSFDIEYDEDSSIFRITKIAGGQSNIPLYPILLELGISHNQMAREWGAQVTETNKNTDPKILARARAAFGIKGNKSLTSYLKDNKLDAETTKTTLGQSFENVDGLMLLKSSKKLLDVHLGNKEPEDPNSLASKEFLGVEDFISERLEKNKQSLQYKVKRHVDNVKRVKLGQIINPGAFNSVVEGFFISDSKAATTEQTNPLSMLSEQYKVTVMGEGGVTSEHMLTEDMRNVHPTHYGFIDPVHTPESSKIGANLHLPLGAIKDGKRLKSVFLDKRGKAVTLTSEQVFDKKVAFSGEEKKPQAKVLYRGEIKEVPLDEVDYFTPDAKATFSYSTNLVPFLQNDQGNRTMMAAKMHEQAISLKYREKPLVQVEAQDGKSMEKMLGGQMSLTSPVSGVIHKIEDDRITIKGDDGKTHEVNAYSNFHLNRKSFLHHDLSALTKGQKVKEGELLADNNFTVDGELALGTNLKTAYLPYKGYNFEDGIVITESAAKKLTSEHIHKFSLPVGQDVTVRLSTFRANYPNLLTPQNMSKIGDDGVVKEGERVESGDIIIAAVQARQTEGMNVALFSKRLSNRPKDISVAWNKQFPGIVQKVIKNRGEVTVVIKSEEEAVVGDKVAGRHGNKGVITKIIADSDAPKTKDGEPIDMLLNPHGIISRINIGQIYESATAKIADKEGSPRVVKNFAGDNYYDLVAAELKKAGIDDKEDVFDPNGKRLGRVHVGKPHILKLFKQTEGNFSAREGGAGKPYDLNQQPLKLGGDESPKTMDMLTMYSMLAHGARENLRETAALKSQKNDDYWTALKTGRALPPPQRPFAFDKFLSYLNAAGVDTREDGNKITLAPLTDKQVLEQSNGEITKPVFYRAKDMQEINGGFFDKAKTGGLKGNRWTHLTLNEPVVNPVFEKAVKKITNLGGKYDKFVAGKLFLHEDGTMTQDAKDGSLTGGSAIKKILSEINVDKEYDKTVSRLEKAKGAMRDDLNKKARYLKALKDLEMKPEEAYIRSSVPVLPPQFRPIYTLPDGNVASSDVNFLYQNMGVLNKMFEQPVMDLLPEDEKADIRKDMNEHMKAVSGLTDLSVKGRERKGFISQIAGPQPKKGFFIDKVLSKQQDYVGRGTIIPEPSLGVDEMGMPEEMAWRLFSPFVIRELRKVGKTPSQAQTEIDNRTSIAKQSLERVMANRTVLLNRAPSLHKFSIMAFQPKLTEGKSIKIPPLVTKAFNADFDGDTMTVHTPISEEALEESRKMMPSRNLYQPGTGNLMMAPDQEAQLGIYYMSKTQGGRDKLNKILGTKYAVKNVLTGGETKKLLKKISEQDPNEFGKIITELKEAGENQSYQMGFSLGMEDIQLFGKQRNTIVNKIQSMVTKNPENVNQINQSATRLVDELLSNGLKNKNNAFFDMVESGARGKMTQVRSILASPLFLDDAKGMTIPHVIKKSYAEGLDPSDYWMSLYGARKGMIDRSVQTSVPGAYAKDIINNTLDMVIAKDDCNTKEGVDYDIDRGDILGRYLAGEHRSQRHNTLVDQKVASILKRSGFKKVKVRSPLTCELEKGVCQKCYGLDEFKKDADIGDNVGAKAGQAIAEPLVQLAMNSFHSGGVAGSGINASGIKRIDQLLKMPKIVAGAAKLAPIDGTVVSVAPWAGGGNQIVIKGDDGKDYDIKTAQGRKVLVTMGGRVKKGDALSDGPIKPQELASMKGFLPAQRYMVDELQKEYKSQGPNIHAREFETLVRSVTDLAIVTNNPGDSDFIPGDITSFRKLDNMNRNRVQELSLEEAMGSKLAERVATLPAGKVLDERDINLLKTMGYSVIKIEKDKVDFEPNLRNITSLPVLQDDWMAALGYRNLKSVIQEGAARGKTSDMSGYNPIPAYARGVFFGKGKDGKY